MSKGPDEQISIAPKAARADEQISIAPKAARADEQISIAPKAAARMVGVSDATMYRWLASGAIKKIVMPGGRLIRVPMDEIHRLRDSAR